MGAMNSMRCTCKMCRQTQAMDELTDIIAEDIYDISSDIAIGPLSKIEAIAQAVVEAIYCFELQSTDTIIDLNYYIKVYADNLMHTILAEAQEQKGLH